jgi:hypothetical protein
MLRALLAARLSQQQASIVDACNHASGTHEVSRSRFHRPCLNSA